MAAACLVFAFTFTTSPALKVAAFDPQSRVAVLPDTSMTVQGTVAASNDVALTAVRLMAIKSAKSDLNIAVLLVQKYLCVPISSQRVFTHGDEKNQLPFLYPCQNCANCECAA